MAEAIVSGIKRASGWSIALGVIMIILGIIAIMAPWEFGLLIVLVVGWAAIFNGVAQLIYAFRTHSGGRAILEGILGLSISSPVFTCSCIPLAACWHLRCCWRASCWYMA